MVGVPHVTSRVNRTEPSSPAGVAQLRRRPDVQGLRGIAVLAVVLFHAGGQLPSGFTGVDVFFVISGFVITRLLVGQWLHVGRLNLLEFYRRRILRLMPAATTMALVTLVASFLFLSPLTDQVGIGKAAVAQALLSSNLYFAFFTGGYFEPSVESNTFLHTWSLGVEEQFYLGFPLFLVLALSASRHRPMRTLAIALAALGATSFIACLALTYGVLGAGEELTSFADRHASLAFYTPIARAWQFAFGASLVLVEQLLFRTAGADPTAPRRDCSSGAGREFRRTVALRSGSVLGWILLAASFTVVPQEDFPGAAALLPSCAAALLLTVGIVSPRHASTGILATAPLTWLGDRSYSWYLWHWPFIVVAQQQYPESRIALVVACGLSLAVAALAYRFVEHPIRSQPHWRSNPRFLGLAVGCLVATLGAGAVFSAAAQGSWGSAHVGSLRSAMDAQHADRTDPLCQRSEPLGRLPERCLWRNPDNTGVALLIGDSHAGHLSEAMIGAMRIRHLDLDIRARGACPFLLRDTYPDDHCRRFVEDSIAQLRAHPQRYKLVVISNAGAGYLKKEPSPNQDRWAADLRRTLQALSQSRNVLVISDVPILPGAPTCAAPAPIDVGSRTCVHRSDQPLIQLRDALTRRELHTTHEMHRAYLDLRDSICEPNGGSCSALRADGSLRYRDLSHLTVEGSRDLAGPIARAVGRLPALS